MTKTEENLLAGFSGESMARNKYMFYAKVARKQGYHYIANIFEETAENEVQHAKEQFKKLNGIGDTAANLKAAIEGEHHEQSSMYPGFAKDAEEEGEVETAQLFKHIAAVEEKHEERFRRLLELVEKGTVFKRDEPITWKCSKCGHIHVGTEPPKACPCCKHEAEYFLPGDFC